MAIMTREDHEAEIAQLRQQHARELQKLGRSPRNEAAASDSESESRPSSRPASIRRPRRLQGRIGSKNPTPVRAVGVHAPRRIEDAADTDEGQGYLAAPKETGAFLASPAIVVGDHSDTEATPQGWADVEPSPQLQTQSPQTHKTPDAQPNETSPSAPNSAMDEARAASAAILAELSLEEAESPSTATQSTRATGRNADDDAAVAKRIQAAEQSSAARIAAAEAEADAKIAAAERAAEEKMAAADRAIEARLEAAEKAAATAAKAAEQAAALVEERVAAAIARSEQAAAAAEERLVLASAQQSSTPAPLSTASPAEPKVERATPLRKSSVISTADRKALRQAELAKRIAEKKSERPSNPERALSPEEDEVARREVLQVRLDRLQKQTVHEAWEDWSKDNVGDQNSPGWLSEKVCIPAPPQCCPRRRHSFVTRPSARTAFSLSLPCTQVSVSRSNGC